MDSFKKKNLFYFKTCHYIFWLVDSEVMNFLIVS